MQKIKKYSIFIFTFLLLFMFFVPNEIFCVSSSNHYTIESYDINMIVNENNTFDITEEIIVNFALLKQEIVRKIPLKNSVTRRDETTSNNRARIYNVFVNENYTTSKEDDYYVIKIGRSNKPLIGRRSYMIKYTYDVGKDPLKEADELYYNLIGDQWDTSIENVTFKISMPKYFDQSLLGFSSGNTGSSDSSNVSYRASGYTITGSTINPLKAGQGLTIRLSLPEDYFVGESSFVDMYTISVMVICLIFIFIAYLLWAKYGKDDVVVETVEFYPPEGYNSAEVGFLYKGYADTRSVLSLLIYLANKGYLKIEEIEKKGIFQSKGFKITKIKEYDGNNIYEKHFFRGLFFLNNTSVTKSDLRNRFYITLNEIKKELNSIKDQIFEPPTNGKRKWFVLMILVMFILTIFILITIKPIFAYGNLKILLFVLLFPGLGVSLLIASLMGFPKMSTSSCALFSGATCFLLTYFLFPTLKQDPKYLILYIFGIISIVVILFFAKIISKRLPYGNEILGKLRGFKRFLETAEKPQLESLVEKNPEYFYDILPYTYALGVSDVWIHQFKTIAMKSPSWYDSRNPFNMQSFGIFMATTMASASSAMTSHPSSSRSGGFSGGGSGGGGGGSW